jgi:hypothetical protein
MRSAIAMLMLVAFAGAAQARPPEVARNLPGAEQVGAARYQVLGFSVFDATLWAGGGDFSWEQPFAIEIVYRRNVSARMLANRSIQEMGAEFEPLRARLTECFADVSVGDRIVGVSTGADSAVFYHNGVRQCELEAPGLRRPFFGIWLNRQGNERAFSRRLLGQQG